MCPWLRLKWPAGLWVFANSLFASLCDRFLSLPVRCNLCGRTRAEASSASTRWKPGRIERTVEWHSSTIIWTCSCSVEHETHKKVFRISRVARWPVLKVAPSVNQHANWKCFQLSLCLLTTCNRGHSIAVSLARRTSNLNPHGTSPAQPQSRHR